MRDYARLTREQRYQIDALPESRPYQTGTANSHAPRERGLNESTE